MWTSSFIFPLDSNKRTSGYFNTSDNHTLPESHWAPCFGSGPTLWKLFFLRDIRKPFLTLSKVFLCFYRKLNHGEVGEGTKKWVFPVAIISQGPELLWCYLSLWSLTRVCNKMWLSQAQGKHLTLKNRLQRPAGMIVWKLLFSLFPLFLFPFFSFFPHKNEGLIFIIFLF